MKIYIYLAASTCVFIVFVVLVALIWRFASRSRTLPCPAWLRWCVELDNPFTKTTQAAFIVGHLKLEPGMTVLDVGCGTGRLTIPIARSVGNQGVVLAMDIQAKMLALVKVKAETAGLNNIGFLHAGAGEGKLAGGRFDRALLVTVLGEIPEQEKALQEIFTALRPGGILSVTEIIFDPHFQSRRTVTRLAIAAGFQEKKFYGNRIAFILNFEKPLHG